MNRADPVEQEGEDSFPMNPGHSHSQALCSSLAWGIFPWLFHCTWPSSHLQASPSLLPASISPPPFTHPDSEPAVSSSPGLFWLCPQVSSPISSDLTRVCFSQTKTISSLKRNSAIDIINYVHRPSWKSTIIHSEMVEIIVYIKER